MAEIRDASPEVDNLVQEVGAELGLTQIGVEFKTLCVSKASNMVSVSKASKVTEHYAKSSDLVIVTVFEDAFDLLDDQAKYLAIRRELDIVSFDSEKGKVNLNEPTITITVGFYNKMKDAAMKNAELCLLTINQLEEKRKEEKRAEREAKKGKKKHTEE